MSKICKKVIVTSMGGTTGKTSISKQVIAPRLGNCKLVHIETINPTGSDKDIKISSEQLEQLVYEIGLVTEDESLVVDIGASNIEAVLKDISIQYGSIVFQVDTWVIPTVPETKSIEETAMLVKILIDLGVEPGAIVVVPNKLKSTDEYKIFNLLKDHVEGMGARFLKEYIPVMPIINKAGDRLIPEMAKSRLTSKEAYFEELAKVKGDKEAMGRLQLELMSANASFKANQTLDIVFAEIFG